MEDPFAEYQAEIECLEAEKELLIDVVESLRYQVRAQNARILELENGSCRFNCRTMKEAFIAGYLSDLQHDEMTREHADRAYREWRENERLQARED